METVIETPAYLAQAEDAGMTAGERTAAVDMLAANPTAGDLMQGTGGCRKVRLAGKGKGKSGGYRLITYFGGGDYPVYMLAVFSKGDRANLTKGEKNGLADYIKRLRASR